MTVDSCSVLFVCMGNICRSPTAEGVFRRMAADAGLAGRVRVDSAGTHAFHIGEPPDPRAQAAAAKRGYDLSRIRARRVEHADFERFDLILAMDFENRAYLARLAPPAAAPKLALMLEYARCAPTLEVPDPYYGGALGFETVLDLLEDASRGLIAALQAGRRAP
ncbi:MAG: low molecular weight phosphotyrosine protein phosphatase [Burkholderiales bacterium]|nr:low molecular weight phosphotyrosine protein phosphatase [Burkholderiales bacterium]